MGAMRLLAFLPALPLCAQQFPAIEGRNLIGSSGFHGGCDARGSPELAEVVKPGWAATHRDIT
jgi:hypothetical protein